MADFFNQFIHLVFTKGNFTFPDLIESPEFLSSITIDVFEVYSAFSSIKVAKAMGMDNLSCRFLNPVCAIVLCYPLHRLLIYLSSKVFTIRVGCS